MTQFTHSVAVADPIIDPTPSAYEIERNLARDKKKQLDDLIASSLRLDQNSVAAPKPLPSTNIPPQPYCKDSISSGGSMGVDMVVDLGHNLAPPPNQTTSGICPKDSELETSLCPSATFLASDVDGASSGIASLWNLVSFNGTLIHSAKNYLIVNMKDLRSHFEWYLINVYAPNAISPQASLWSFLENFILNSSMDFWMVVGDFNSPLYPSEKSGGIEDYSRSINDLVDFIFVAGMMDIHPGGSKLSWSKPHSGQIR
ncbi:hypothetical protein SUGI_0742270 [Cryptomeria japonica]|nr:hypothetical protein SUGI_0742270 [Cryptomeria japonica]